LRRQNHTLGNLFAFKELGGGFDRLTATIDNHVEMVTGELVSGNYFEGSRRGPSSADPLSQRTISRLAAVPLP